MIKNLTIVGNLVTFIVSARLLNAKEGAEFALGTAIPRAFPAIVDPKIVSAKIVEGEFVRNHELVLGLVMVIEPELTQSMFLQGRSERLSTVI